MTRAVRDWGTVDRFKLRQVKRAAARTLPADWLPRIEDRAKRGAPFMGQMFNDVRSQAEVWNEWAESFGGAAAADLTDAQIKAQASAYAIEAQMMDVGLLTDGGAWQEYARLLDFCRRRDVEAPPVGLLLAGMGARVRCPYWWRRAIRKMVARKCERGALSLGLVCKPNHQPYASNKAVSRRIDQNRRNLKALESIVFENDAGYRRSLAELAATSTSNKSIRRGELMTRIRGCEEIADACDHPGLFLTLTCPSRFHSTLRDGRPNPKHDGSDPRAAQSWLCRQWARARAAMARHGCIGYGFRVAEPHHDGCTHWHALLWFSCAAAMAAALAIIRDYWLRDAGDEPGAQKYRINAKRMETGGAAGYVAKYISKNIDDHGITNHLDDYAEGEIAPDLLGDLEIKPSMRVEAWASTWGIRQFQPLGQPPVTVWRELRRVKESEARSAGVGGIVHSAWLAAQKTGGVLADWGRYVKAQGGMLRGRRCHVVMRHDLRECDGLYGRQVRAVPVGVALNIGCARTVWSERRLWTAVEGKAKVETVGRPAPVLDAQRAAPWTGVNNCTDDDDAAAIRADYLRGLGNSTEENPTCDDLSWRPNRPGAIPIPNRMN